MESQNIRKSPSFEDLQMSADDADNDDVFVDLRSDTNEEDWSSKIEKQNESAISQNVDSSNDVLTPDTTAQNESPLQELDKKENNVVSESASSLDDALHSEKKFIEYVLSLPTGCENATRTTSKKIGKAPIKTSGGGTKVGLDHLDNLCKLMEQLSELREANSKLHKRVQYLEDLKSIHEMHKEVNNQYGSENILSEKFDTPDKKMVHLDYICMESQEVVERPSSRSKERRYVVHKSKTQVNISRTHGGCTRERSKSVGHEEICDSKSKRILPKWSKVKEALKFEKNTYPRIVSEYCSDRKNERLSHSDEDGILRVPLDSEEFNKDDDDSLTDDFYVPRTYSPIIHSSMEDLRENIASTTRKDKWKSRSVYVSEKLSSELSQNRSNHHQKKIPNLHSRDVMPDRRQKSLTLERDIDPEQVFSKYEKEFKKGHKSPWGRVKTIIQSRKDSLRRRQKAIEGMKKTEDTNVRIITENADDFSKDNLSYNKIYFESTESSPNLSNEIKNSSHEETDNTQTQRNKPDPLRISPLGEETFHSDRSPPDFDDFGGYKDVRTPSSSPSYQQNLCPEVTQSRCNSEENSHSKLVASTSAPIFNFTAVEQLQRNLSEDFNRKIKEWEKIRSGGPKMSSPKFERKGSGTTKSRKSNKDKGKWERQEKVSKPKMKDLNWLEKELQKIEKEKIRLAKEKQKYEERAVRLERLRETVLSARTANKKEVLVRTSAGEFRFEGISDAFTKKLYEWETKLGVGPELSTLALLDASFKTSPGGEKHTSLQRGLSKSESSIIEVSQPSHNSSNSLPSLKPEDASVDRPQPSRANSEPDLSYFGQQKEMPARYQSGDVLCNLPLQTYSPPEVTQLIDSNSEEGLAEKIRDQQENQADDNYYNLLEENVILLEQLKSKEDICRRLEKELTNLDKKMEEMNRRHNDDLDKYKEKLWEIHGPRNKSIDVHGCMKMLNRLKNRIEELERCGERLKCDRDALEESFRYHNQQQAQMTIDLIGKMKELQKLASNSENKYNFQNSEKFGKLFDRDNVNRLHLLSAELLKQTQNLEQALAERTRQVCHLRWELLHRDVSALRLHTELHSVRWQGGAARAAAKRAKFAEKRSLSSSERLFPWEKENETRQELPERLLKQSSDAYVDWNKVGFETSDLTTTVHELNKELLKLSSTAETILRNDDHAGISETDSIDKNQEDPVKISSVPLPIDNDCYNTIHLKISSDKPYSDQIRVRRNSADNVSSLSETSNLHDEESKVTSNACDKNVSSSVESLNEEYFNKISIKTGQDAKKLLVEDSTQQMVLEYSDKHLNTNKYQKSMFLKNTRPKKMRLAKLHDQTQFNVANNKESGSYSSDHSHPNHIDSSKSDFNQLKYAPKERLIFRSMSSDYPYSNIEERKLCSHNENNKQNSLKAESPIIRSRNPRKFKRDFPRDVSASNCENCHQILKKSTSQPECISRYKYSKNQAPNVRILIERYNKKVQENKEFKTFNSTSKSPSDKLTSFNVSVTIGNQDSSISGSQTRAQMLKKAKEQFISQNCCPNFTLPSDTKIIKKEHQEGTNDPNSKYCRTDDDNSSTNSALSTDSVNLVLCRSAELCKESRLARRSLAEKQQLLSEEISPPITPTIPDAKLGKSFLNFKLRKSKKEKELASISELCRQSLFLNINKDNSKSEEDKSLKMSPQSCPSSPELKSKPSKNKGSWLHKTFFKQS